MNTLNNGGDFYKSLNGSATVAEQLNAEPFRAMDVMEFFERYTKFCASIPGIDGCERCCMRFFCFRPISEWNYEIVKAAVSYLREARIRTDKSTDTEGQGGHLVSYGVRDCFNPDFHGSGLRYDAIDQKKE